MWIIPSCLSTALLYYIDQTLRIFKWTQNPSSLRSIFWKKVAQTSTFVVYIENKFASDDYRWNFFIYSW